MEPKNMKKEKKRKQNCRQHLKPANRKHTLQGAASVNSAFHQCVRLKISTYKEKKTAILVSAFLSAIITELRVEEIHILNFLINNL